MEKGHLYLRHSRWYVFLLNFVRSFPKRIIITCIIGCQAIFRGNLISYFIPYSRIPIIWELNRVYVLNILFRHCINIIFYYLQKKALYTGYACVFPYVSFTIPIPIFISVCIPCVCTQHEVDDQKKTDVYTQCIPNVQRRVV